MFLDWERIVLFQVEVYSLKIKNLSFSQESFSTFVENWRSMCLDVCIYYSTHEEH